MSDLPFVEVGLKLSEIFLVESRHRDELRRVVTFSSYPSLPSLLRNTLLPPLTLHRCHLNTFPLVFLPLERSQCLETSSTSDSSTSAAHPLASQDCRVAGVAHRVNVEVEASPFREETFGVIAFPFDDREKLRSEPSTHELIVLFVNRSDELFREARNVVLKLGVVEDGRGDDISFAVDAERSYSEEAASVTDSASDALEATNLTIDLLRETGS